MTWAGERRFVIASIVGAFIIFIIALIAVPTVYHSPSCSDQTQNQGEQGVDCGGPCTYLCVALQEPPVVRFTKALRQPNGRVDIVASIDNSNAKTAAQSVHYTVTLYAGDQSILKRSSGTVDLLPSSNVPLYLPNFYLGPGIGSQAFVTIDADAIQWYSLAEAPPLPEVGSPTLAGTATNPRITVMLSNPSPQPFMNVKVIAIIYDARENVIGASQTVLPVIGGQASETAIFTWNEAFSATPARIEVLPTASLAAHP